MRRLLLLALVGCVHDGAFRCEAAADCGASGTCESTHLCSFDDTTCTSGRRYGDFAGSLAGECVDDGVPPLDAGRDAIVDSLPPPDGPLPVDGPQPIDAEPPPDTPVASCGTAYGDPYGSSRYRLLLPHAWVEAENACEMDGAHLAVIGSAGENNHVSGLFGDAAWIGYSDRVTTGTFLWVTGVSSAYMNWAAGDPDGGATDPCVAMNETGKWYDAHCPAGLGAICECDGVAADPMTY